MKRSIKTLVVAMATFVPAYTAPAVAYAITCNAIPSAADASGPLPPVVYIQAANEVGPFIATLQQALSVDPNPINVVYIEDGGCAGANRFFANQPIAGNMNKRKPTYYAAQVQASCDLPTTGGPNNGPPLADIAASDVYAPTCGMLPSGQLPTYVGDFLGPIQPMLFVVPRASSQRSISASAAYFVFGFGDNSGVAPWTNNGSIYRRNSSSAMQALLSSAIGVPLARWSGVDAAMLAGNTGALSGAASVINALEVDPNPEAAIGVLAASNIDATTATHVAVLAYKDSNQSCAYYPDSTPTAHDKRNVRDGHYSLWGPVHFFAYIDAHGAPEDPNVARVISYLTGTAVAPGGVDLIQVDAANNLVPSCAMHVARTVEMGELVSFAPSGSCSCYYDYVATGQSTCQKCSKASDCPTSAPVCNLSYPASFCETQ
jgi:hypothetical protein